MSELALQRRGILCVVSGPSGSGKTTLCRRLSCEDEEAVYAISATTRQPRTGEYDGTDYYFLSREDFEARATRGEFLEYAEVHGNLYGTLKSEVLNHISAGRDVLMDIDVQGAGLIRENSDRGIQDALVDIFILPRNEEDLLDRLRNRGTENDDQLKLRLRNALDEMKHWDEYAYTIISGNKEEDFAIFQSMIESERCRSKRLKTVETTQLEQEELGL